MTDQGYGKSDPSVLNTRLEPLERVTPYLTDQWTLGEYFGAA